uniref:Proteinase inhibitor I42 chagasin domain-containing protein n=2 Tax=Candidatus Berkiella aquae TaxID=295108 RepID=A0A0Q9YYB0_9GAMM
MLGMANQANAVNPSLIDLRVNDTTELRFTTGVDYLLVIDNDNPHGTSWYFGEFAQSILTQYLQGAANVTQDSLTVPSNAKVLWLFSPHQPGEFDYYAINGSSSQKGARGKIIITLAESAVTENLPAEEQPTNDQEKTPPVIEKRRLLKGGRRD